MNTDIYQNHEIKDIKKEMNGKVSWIVFGLYITICLSVFGWVITNIIRTQDKVDGTNERIGSVESDFSAIKTDIRWIRESINEIKNNGTRN